MRLFARTPKKNLLPDDAYVPHPVTGRVMSQTERADLDKRIQKQLRITPLPTEPGIYRDGTGEHWTLDTKGGWTDHLGAHRDVRYAPLLALFIEKSGPFVPANKVRYASLFALFIEKSGPFVPANKEPTPHAPKAEKREESPVSLKTPEQLGREVIDATYGIGTEWEEPNEHGEEGFTRAQNESDIEADDIRLLIEQAIKRDRAQIRAALASSQAVTGIRDHSVPSVSAMIDAYAEWDGEVDTFVVVWDEILAGREFPCPEHPAGIHSTYLCDDSSCDYCGDSNR